MKRANEKLMTLIAQNENIDTEVGVGVAIYFQINGEPNDDANDTRSL